MSAALAASDQLSFWACKTAFASKNFSRGSSRAVVTPNTLNAGPIPRINTHRGDVPRIENPAIIAPSPPFTWLRAETLIKRRVDDAPASYNSTRATPLAALFALLQCAE